ncbi:MAG: hypothetical protein NC218_07685 [Acetobacter sp.]|nr:hypothetical protein [Acetobacter sp.]
MIEIALDENIENTFLNAERPTYIINDTFEKTWKEYRELARKVITMYGDMPIIIIRNNNPNFSNNWFAVALFVESCFIKNKLECVVFKVENREKALQAYKPFIALTIGIKYIIRLYQEELDNIYKEIAGLSYLGLDIKEDYLENKLYMELPSAEEAHILTAQTKEEALTVVAILKSIALTQQPIHFKAEISKVDEKTIPNIDTAIENVVAYVCTWIN